MAEGGGLLNRYTVKSCIGGSNPPLSARLLNINHLEPPLRTPTRKLPARTVGTFVGTLFRRD